MSLPVFLADAATLAGAVVGDEIATGGEVAAHAVRVRRMVTGQALQIVDGSGTRVTGELTTASPDDATLRVTEVSHEPAPAPQLVLVQALSKGERDLAAIEAATEVGVDVVVPWAAQRSIADWPAKKAAKSAAKWHNTLVAATLQARRARIPELQPLVRGTGLAEITSADDAWIVMHETATAHLPGVLEDAQAQRTLRRIVLVVGPEGGITDAELAALSERGAATAVLGPTILRASTAGPVALGICQVGLGRWV